MSHPMVVSSISSLVDEIRACRRCVEAPLGKPLGHEPRPVLRVSETARILIVGQAPGTRVHQSGVPFTDRSGQRLRQWMGVDDAVFYDEARIAIVPMGFCFPGLDAKGGDLPPRPECAKTWHDRLFAALPAADLILAIGLYAQRYHFNRLGLAFDREETLTARVQNWRSTALRNAGPIVFPLPHPSWRNTGWLKANPWFESDVLPALRMAIAARL